VSQRPSGAALTRDNVRRMDRQTLRLLALLRRVLCELHAQPPGTLPPDLDDAVAVAVAPGFRDRVLARYLKGLTPEGGLQ
jgi:hypothetical protein